VASEDFPDFFARVPTITVRDKLAEFLGAAVHGTMTYRYEDAVRLAGHSCPTVAGAYLMVLNGLRALYGDELPVRGEIEVFMADARDSGANGVVATVVQLLTGAAAETGFHGIGGQFSRRDLLKFDQPVAGTFALRRMDTGKAVQVSLNAAIVPWTDEMRGVMPKAVGGYASDEDLARFGKLWQGRVCTMLTEHATDPRMVQVSEWRA
jgi:formylmethanofuran dehydrogenase subunit E